MARARTLFPRLYYVPFRIYFVLISFVYILR